VQRWRRLKMKIDKKQAEAQFTLVDFYIWCRDMTDEGELGEDNPVVRTLENYFLACGLDYRSKK
jgi:hypothetical protein